MADPDSSVLELLRAMRSDMTTMRSDMTSMRDVMATRADVADVRSELQSLRADVASDMLVMRKEIGEQVAGLRRAVVEYHSSVIGHGPIISDLEARVRRLEQHLSIGGQDAR